MISNPSEIDELASELAKEYVEYFDIDTTEQKQRLEESIDEHLAHLEEVSSVLDTFIANSSDVDKLLDKIDQKKEPLEKLYDRIDAIEQQMFEINHLLDKLEATIQEVESQKKQREDLVYKLKDLANVIYTRWNTYF